MQLGPGGPGTDPTAGARWASTLSLAVPVCSYFYPSLRAVGLPDSVCDELCFSEAGLGWGRQRVEGKIREESSSQVSGTGTDARRLSPGLKTLPLSSLSEQGSPGSRSRSAAEGWPPPSYSSSGDTSRGCTHFQ